MPEVYLDACCLIYLTEGTAAWRAAVGSRLKRFPVATRIVTSRLSRLECRSKPLRERDDALLARYDAAFATTRIVDVTEAVIERATEIRARYGLRAPDAIHLATAINDGAEVFLTGDAALARCVEIVVDVLVAASP